MINNILKISLLIILTLIGLNEKSITLGELWKVIHVNSLVGFQKFIEKLSFHINIDIWFNIILPILKFKFILTLVTILLIIFIYDKIKK